jgi:hypothetical protein
LREISYLLEISYLRKNSDTLFLADSLFYSKQTQPMATRHSSHIGGCCKDVAATANTIPHVADHPPCRLLRSGRWENQKANVALIRAATSVDLSSLAPPRSGLSDTIATVHPTLLWAKCHVSLAGVLMINVRGEVVSASLDQSEQQQRRCK